MTRREWFAAVAAAANVPDPTKFQLGCMTLPYAAFPLQRALSSAWPASSQPRGSLASPDSTCGGCDFEMI